MIAIVDYGVGNLRSVEKAFHFIGQNAQVTSDRQMILDAHAVVLPGVGAYADAMERLGRDGLVDVVKTVIRKGKPFLGICLGFQLLFRYSEEGGDRVEGLGFFDGAVKLLRADRDHKVPHMGWNSLDIKKTSLLFRNLPQRPYVYFVHSYCIDAAERNVVAATACYGRQFDAAVEYGKVFATQFHPEKSGEVGLTILRNWVSSL